MHQFSAPILVFALLCACQPTAQQGKELTELYTLNKQARREKLDECLQTGGLVREDFACLIAADIEKRDSIGSFRDLPPLDLLGSGQDASGSATDQN